MKTKIFEKSRGKKKFFNVWEIDKDGNQEGDYALVDIGIKKAKAIINHIEELKEFVKENDK